MRRHLRYLTDKIIFEVSFCKSYLLEIQICIYIRDQLTVVFCRLILRGRMFRSTSTKHREFTENANRKKLLKLLHPASTLFTIRRLSFEITITLRATFQANWKVPLHLPYQQTFDGVLRFREENQHNPLSLNSHLILYLLSRNQM